MGTDKAIANERGLQEHGQKEYEAAVLVREAQASDAADRNLTIW